ncbi:hypothetical protein HK405_005647 [Cladochytrium tenue]|nr:hypothetical protein HK405_005647 [Cladochytrium tenue]
MSLRHPVIRAATRRSGRTLSTTTAAAAAAAVNAVGTPARRAILYVPGSDARKISASLRTDVDSRILDLEDSPVARQVVRDALDQLLASDTSVASANSERAVRINAVSSGLHLADLAAVAPSPSLDAVLIPKVESAQEVLDVLRQLDLLSPRAASLRVMASVESARGVLAAPEIAACGDPRLDALVFAAEDYAADVGLRRTPSRLEMLYARQAVVVAARARGLQAIDLVCVDYKDMDVLRAECTEGRDFGFTGKQAIHPAQVAVIQEQFSPSAKEIEYATKVFLIKTVKRNVTFVCLKIVDGYSAHQEKGLGAFSIDGKMIDMVGLHI